MNVQDLQTTRWGFTTLWLQLYQCSMVHISFAFYMGALRMKSTRSHPIHLAEHTFLRWSQIYELNKTTPINSNPLNVDCFLHALFAKPVWNKSSKNFCSFTLKTSKGTLQTKQQKGHPIQWLNTSLMVFVWYQTDWIDLDTRDHCQAGRRSVFHRNGQSPEKLRPPVWFAWNAICASQLKVNCRNVSIFRLDVASVENG
mgnify:CR=1 FL=1